MSTDFVLPQEQEEEQVDVNVDLVVDAHHDGGGQGEKDQMTSIKNREAPTAMDTASSLVLDDNNGDGGGGVLVDPSSTFKRPAHILPLIVASQFAGTSLWFAGNAVLSDLVEDWQDDGVAISESARGYLTSIVQFGFIVGTLASALFNLADRFRPTCLFLCCSIIGAILNALIPLWKSQVGLIVFRFGTGIALAGIYPVGMKIAADWYPSGLGMALGWLIGALAVGSALPFLLEQINQPWQFLLWETSGIAALGGISVGLFVPDGPFRKPGTKLDPSIVWTLFDDVPFRGAAFGFFGHMWEVYAFWTWCPVVWEAYLKNRNNNTAASWDENAITFGVLAIGGLGCVLGGCFSVKYRSALVAFVTLETSGLLCLLSPVLFLAPSAVMLIAYLIWGMAVVADSPQFSSLVATTAPDTSTGSALMIVNCIGYIITIGSIQLMDVPLSAQYIFLLLAPGPILGCWGMRYHVFPSSTTRTGHDESDIKPNNDDNEETPMEADAAL